MLSIWVRIVGGAAWCDVVRRCMHSQEREASSTYLLLHPKSLGTPPPKGKRWANPQPHPRTPGPHRPDLVPQVARATRGGSPERNSRPLSDTPPQSTSAHPIPIPIRIRDTPPQSTSAHPIPIPIRIRRLGWGGPAERVLDPDPGDGVRAPSGDVGGDGRGGAGTRATVAVAGTTEADRDEATTMGVLRLHDATAAGFAVENGSAQN
eukprot:scaffold13021_cov127-Isochrysis_galbana.AAC.13